MLNCILASLLTDTREVIIISLDYIPVFFIQFLNKICTFSTFWDDWSLVLFSTGHDNVDRNNCLNCQDVLLHGLIVFTYNHCFSNGNSYLWETQIDLTHNSEVLFEGVFLSTTSSWVQSQRVRVWSGSTSNSDVTSKHDGIIEIYSIFVKLANKRSISNSISKGKVHISSMYYFTICLSSNNWGAESLI